MSCIIFPYFFLHVVDSHFTWSRVELTDTGKSERIFCVTSLCRKETVLSWKNFKISGKPNGVKK